MPQHTNGICACSTAQAPGFARGPGVCVMQALNSIVCRLHLSEG